MKRLFALILLFPYCVGLGCTSDKQHTPNYLFDVGEDLPLIQLDISQKPLDVSSYIEAIAQSKQIEGKGKKPLDPLVALQEELKSMSEGRQIKPAFQSGLTLYSPGELESVIAFEKQAEQDRLKAERASRNVFRQVGTIFRRNS